MFYDSNWVGDRYAFPPPLYCFLVKKVLGRYDVQDENWQLWFEDVRTNATKAVMIEIGAGKAVPTVRRRTEASANTLRQSGFEGTIKVIRINPVAGDAQIKDLEEGVEKFSLVLNGEEALVKIGALIDKLKEEKQ